MVTSSEGNAESSAGFATEQGGVLTSVDDAADFDRPSPEGANGHGVWSDRHQNLAVADPDVNAGIKVDAVTETSEFTRDADILAEPDDRLSAEPRTASPSSVPHDFVQSLARLEMSSHEVRLYLDSIDQRISRMEPRLEAVRPGDASASAPSSPAAAAGDLQRDNSQARDESAGSPAGETGRRRSASVDLPGVRHLFGGSGRAGLDSLSEVPVDRRRPRPAANTLDESEPGAWKDILAASWQRRSSVATAWIIAHKRWMPAAGLGVAVLLGLGIWGAASRPGSAGGTAAASASKPTVAAAEPNGMPKSSAVISTRLAGNDATVTQPQYAGSSRITPASPTAFSPASHSSATGVSAPPDSLAGVASPAPLTSEPTARDASEMAEPAAAPRPTDIPYGRVSPAPSRRVNVSSGVMAGNLISSRAPAYPRGLVGLFHPEGTVVMQAIVSRTGRVEDVRVISGHYVLRGPAKDAVRTWRYRPYHVNGYPVEVATIVSVDFRR